MQELLAYISKLSPLQKATFLSLKELFQPIQLKKNEFFVRESEYAQKKGFLKEGIIRAFFINQDGKE